MVSDDRVDVVVIGGGPAGSTASTLIADAGWRVRLYERETFPRYHIGESLIPETYWTLQRLGMLEKMAASPFTQKRSVQFVTGDNRLSAPFYFWDNKPHPSSQTWQVLRSQFDQMLLENAAEHGVDVRQGVRVRQVVFDGQRATGVIVEDPPSETRRVDAQVVVDASGQSGLLMNALGLRVWDPVLNKGAIWAYYRGMRRGGGHDPGATMVIQTANRKGWFWLIPLHDDVTSLGVVAPFDYLFDRQSSHEETYMAELAACPAVNERLTEAERIGEFKATRDYSYRCTEVAGDGWVLVGDAYGFLDPLYSSGVLLAFKSGELAADAVNDGLARGDTSGHQLGRWRDMFNQGVDRMRRLVCEYYDGFSFGKFVRRYPHLKGRVTDLLIGDLFTDQVDDVWPAMESMYPPGKTPPPRWDDPPPETSGASPQKPAPPQRIS